MIPQTRNGHLLCPNKDLLSHPSSSHRRGYKELLRLSSIFAALLLLSGCVPGIGGYTQTSPAGFLSGLWHGVIALASLILRLFDDNVRIYEQLNSGWSYELGFMLGFPTNYLAGKYINRMFQSHSKQIADIIRFWIKWLLLSLVITLIGGLIIYIVIGIKKSDQLSGFIVIISLLVALAVTALNKNP